MPKVQTKDGLTPRQREFTRAVVAGDTPTTAAQKAGYAHPETVGPRMMKHPTIREAITDVLDRHGLTDDYMTVKTLELCEATSPGKDGRMSPDWTARARGLELLARIRGHHRTNVEVTSMTFEQKVSVTADLDKAELIDFLQNHIEHNKQG